MKGCGGMKTRSRAAVEEVPAAPAKVPRSNQKGAPSSSNPTISRPATERFIPSPKAPPGLREVVWIRLPPPLTALPEAMLVSPMGERAAASSSNLCP